MTIRGRSSRFGASSAHTGRRLAQSEVASPGQGQIDIVDPRIRVAQTPHGATSEKLLNESRGAAEMDMRKAGLGALIAALWIGATLAASAEKIPLPQPAPKKQPGKSAAKPPPPPISLP